MKGYKNCIIKVDLSSGNIKKEHLNADYIKRYLGGEGYGIALLWNHMPLDADPLSPENLLSFNTGPMTGTPAPSASRTSVCFMSPLTNTIGASNMGSHFGAELKFAGYDTVAFTGKAEKACISANRQRKGRNKGCILPLGNGYQGNNRGNKGS